MFGAVKAIDWEGRDTVHCFQYTFDFYLGQISVTEVILVHCGIVVPPIHSTRSWQTFTEFCCLVCQQYFASKALQRSFNHCFKTLLFDMWKRDWCGSESELESELESESIFPSRSRSRSRSRWNLVDSAALLPWPNYFFMFSAARPGGAVRATGRPAVSWLSPLLPGGRRQQRCTVETDLHCLLRLGVVPS